jgi:hypothetical protein
MDVLPREGILPAQLPEFSHFVRGFCDSPTPCFSIEEKSHLNLATIRGNGEITMNLILELPPDLESELAARAAQLHLRDKEGILRRE